jgi:hypothetical protein
LKDATAFPMFFLAICLVLWFRDLNEFRGTIVALLTLAFFIDGSFTLQPRLHCTPIGLNEETGFMIAIYVVGLFFICAALVYHFGL